MRVLSLVLTIALAAIPSVVAQDAVTDPEVAKGIEQVENGDFDAAIFTLDTAARRLADDPDQAHDLSRAYLYLGIAYVGKGHEAAAKAKFREAILQMRDLSLSAEEFPPKIIDLFEAAREEAEAAPAATPAVAAEGAEPEKAKGGSKALYVIGGVAVAGGAVALASGGGDGGTTSPTTTRPSTGGGTTAPTVRTFEGQIDNALYQTTFTSPTYDLFIGGTGQLRADMTWSIEGGDGNPGFLALVLEDQDFTMQVGTFNQTSPTAGTLTADVAPLPGASTQTYHLSPIVVDEGCGRCVFSFAINVQHP